MTLSRRGRKRTVPAAAVQRDIAGLGREGDQRADTRFDARKGRAWIALEARSHRF